MNDNYHKPVLLEESVKALKIDPEGTYVDVTYGGGGHAGEILGKLTGGKLIAFDQDAEAIGQKQNDERLVLINQNFRFLKNFLKYHHAIPVKGILADLGVSSHQFNEGKRGFSFRFEGPLDMRMSDKLEMTAADIVNQYSAGELKRIFTQYGEVRNTNKLVKTILGKRQAHKINTIDEFREVMGSCIPRGKENRYLAQVFQALRIEVNQELESLKEFLEQCADVMEEGGRLVVITYHSLEDRLVKNYIKKGRFSGEPEKDMYGNLLVPFRAVNRKPVVPSEEEISENNRARSAKLRIAEKC